MVKLTKEQRKALHKLWLRTSGDRPPYREFRRTVTPGLGWVGVRWCGMYVGIEPDGYTHT